MMSPQSRLNEKRQTAADLEEKLRAAMERQLTQKKHELELAAERLEAHSPVKKLSQGYAFVSDASGRGVREAARVRPGDLLAVHMLDGTVYAEATEVSMRGPLPGSREEE